MKDLRFLGRYIPEFRSIQALAKHDYYHTYTVDEHTLLAIRSLQDLWAGRYPSLSSLYDALRSLRRRWLLMLTVLLHDLGKVYRSGHEHRGVQIAKRVLQRLNIEHEEQERILFLIKNHLLMIALSQRRELTDQKIIADFARTIKDRENLTLLYLLTYADISAVSPSAWTQWKAILLQDLYVRTLTYFDKSEAAAEAEQVRVRAAVQRLRMTAKSIEEQQAVNTFLAVMPEKYLLYVPTQKVLDHVEIMKRLPEERLVIDHRHYPERGYTELTVCAYDAYGMLYRAAGTLAGKNLNIVRAQAYTASNGVMFDIIQVTDSEGRILTYDDAWESLKAELRVALAGAYLPPERGVYRSEKKAFGDVLHSVDFDNDTSDTFTIIDVTGRDRVGFLYHVTKALYELNLDIASAKIVTEGAKVMDSFYVSDLFRKKIYEGNRLEKIKEALLAAMEKRG